MDGIDQPNVTANFSSCSYTDDTKNEFLCTSDLLGNHDASLCAAEDR